MHVFIISYNNYYEYNRTTAMIVNQETVNSYHFDPKLPMSVVANHKFNNILNEPKMENYKFIFSISITLFPIDQISLIQLRSFKEDLSRIYHSVYPSPLAGVEGGGVVDVLQNFDVLQNYLCNIGSLII